MTPYLDALLTVFLWFIGFSLPCQIYFSFLCTSLIIPALNLKRKALRPALLDYWINFVTKNLWVLTKVLLVIPPNDILWRALGFDNDDFNALPRVEPMWALSFSLNETPLCLDDTLDLADDVP